MSKIIDVRYGMVMGADKITMNDNTPVKILSAGSVINQFIRWPSSTVQCTCEGLD